MLVLLWFYRAGLSVCADFLFTKLGSPGFFSKSGTGGNYARLWQECHLKAIWSLKLTGSVVLLCCWFPCTSAIMINFRLGIFRFQNDKWHLRFTNVETVQWDKKLCICVQVCVFVQVWILKFVLLQGEQEVFYVFLPLHQSSNESVWIADWRMSPWIILIGVKWVMWIIKLLRNYSDKFDWFQRGMKIFFLNQIAIVFLFGLYIFIFSEKQEIFAFVDRDFVLTFLGLLIPIYTRSQIRYWR